VCYFGADPETQLGKVSAMAIIEHQKRVADRAKSVGEERNPGKI
jgi:hypothetical protein